MTAYQSYDALRSILASWEPAAGPRGFEGLVAHALASLTGYTFRLVRSGAQFGRDAATPTAPFAIAMEAKRYKDSVPLQELVGKAGLAGFALEGRIDVWTLAATVEVGETTASTLVEVLEHHGITALTLDWAGTGLPRLATLLAATRTEILPWVEEIKGKAERDRIEQELERVVADPRFDDACGGLQSELSPGTVGLDAFRSSSRRWAEKRLSDRRASQVAFSQFVVPLEAGEGAVQRSGIERELDAAIGGPRDERLVAVLGPEGTGKTWAVTRWWSGLSSQPILLLCIGRIADLLAASDEPLDMLARLAALQDGRRDDAAVARWRRRLENWSGWPSDEVRFIVVLDGLNETSGKQWASILCGLAPTVASLGGALVATCREGYWQREIQQRLALVRVKRVDVGDYNDDEFRAVLHRSGVDPRELTPELSKFMRNPRVCALALRMLPQLAGIPHLTVERLLLEYWRARLFERGDLVGHDARDFNKLLISHARAYRERPGIRFDRDEWLSHSGAARRADGRTLRDDLTDIEEGRFFNAADGRYTFRPEALRFALGLLLADEIKEALSEVGSNAIEAVECIIDAVRGFDIVAEIVASAIGIACLDESFSDAGVATLITCWMSLQNVPDDVCAALQPYVSERPQPFLDAFESRVDDRDDRRFLTLLLLVRDEPVFGGALAKRLDRWLGSWSRQPASWGGEAADEARRAVERNASIDKNVATMTGEERAMFDRLCPERRHRAGLATAAALLLAGRPQAEHATGLVAHSLVLAVANDIRMPTEELSWAVRLNLIDHPELAERVRAMLKPLCAETASVVGKRAAAYCLRLLGTQQDAELAEALLPTSRVEGWRRVEHYCAVDPLDPSTVDPSNISNAVAAAGRLEVEQLWNHMSYTAEDHELKMIIPGLARFRPQPILTLLRELIASVTQRNGLSLRQLSWQLPWLSPIFDDKCIAAVRTAIQHLYSDPSRAPAQDFNFVFAMLAESLAPHLSAEEQLALLLSMPAGVPYTPHFHRHARPLAPSSLEHALTTEADSGRLARVLLFASAHPVNLTAASRDLVACALTGHDSEVSSAAAEFTVMADDEQLDEKLLWMPFPPTTDRSRHAGSLRRAFSTAVARRRRLDLIERVAGEHLGWMTNQLPEAAGALAGTIEACLNRLAVPIAADPPETARIELEIEENELRSMMRLSEREQPHSDPFEVFSNEMNDTNGEMFARRQELMREEMEAFLDRLALEGALCLAQAPNLNGLDQLVERAPDRCADWLQRILATRDPAVTRQLQNLGLPLAQAFAARDPAVSAEVFGHLWTVEPHVNLLVGRARLRLRDLTLFGAVTSPEIDQLRRDVLLDAKTDEELELLVLAAEQNGQRAWLDDFVDRAGRSPYPREQALALTVASLRPTNASTDALLVNAHGSGFLASIAEAGLRRYRRDAWTRHWFDNAERAESGTEFWCLQEIGVAASDRRAALWLGDDFRRQEHYFGGDLGRRLERRWEKVSRELGKTLFGQRKPSGLLPHLLADGRRPDRATMHSAAARPTRL